MSDRQSYKSDLSDERWALIDPVIRAWKARHRSVSGHQGNYDMREIVNALLYQSRTGCQWDYLPGTPLGTRSSRRCPCGRPPAMRPDPQGSSSSRRCPPNWVLAHFPWRAD